MEPQVEKCRTCKFFGNTEPQGFGLCHRYPPKLISDPYHKIERQYDDIREFYISEGVCEFPLVYKDEGCGEHQPRKEA